MKKMLLAVAMFALAFATALPAFADSFNYTYTGTDGVTATGIITGNLIGADEYQLTSGTINLTGAPDCTNCGALSGPLDGAGVLVANPPYTFEVGGGTTLNGLDDLFFPNANPELSTNGGLAFLMSDGLGFGIGGNGPGSYWGFGGNWTVDGNGTFTTSPTPEPGSLALLGTGILGLAGIARRKFNRA